MRLCTSFPSPKKSLGSIHHLKIMFVYWQCCQNALKIQLYLFILQAHLGHWTVYLICFTSCWFWLTSSISQLTLCPLNFKTALDWKRRFSFVPQDDISVVLHFPEETCCLFAFVRWTLKAIERERQWHVFVCVCADGRQGRLHFLGQASGHLGCPGNPVLAGLLGNNPLLFQMI